MKDDRLSSHINLTCQQQLILLNHLLPFSEFREAVFVRWCVRSFAVEVCDCYWSLIPALHSFQMCSVLGFGFSSSVCSSLLSVCLECHSIFCFWCCWRYFGSCGSSGRFSGTVKSYQPIWFVEQFQLSCLFWLSLFFCGFLFLIVVLPVAAVSGFSLVHVVFIVFALVVPWSVNARLQC